jgi:DNA-binding CsgD family transcriptional regulator
MARVMMQEPVAVRGRMARAQDAAAMLGFLERHLWRQAVSTAGLIDYCAAHLSAGTLRGGMIEEVHNRADEPLVLSAVGASAFVTDDAIAEFLTGERPMGALEMLLKAGRGQGGILAGEADIAEGNAGDGLNLLVIGFAHRYDNPEDPRCRALLARAIGHFVEAHSGFLLKQAAREDPEPVASVLINSGMREIRRYRLGEMEIAVTHRGRDDALPIFPDSITAQIFAHAPPIIRFSAAQRALLELAGESLTDADIAAALGISINTVKRTWKLIYERVEARAPQVIGARQAGATHVRGAERRRHLISYLKQHPQELRPHA